LHSASHPGSAHLLWNQLPKDPTVVYKTPLDALEYALQRIEEIKCSETRMFGDGFVYILARASLEPPLRSLHLILIIRCTLNEANGTPAQP
jgi:hypothetical protein